MGQEESAIAVGAADQPARLCRLAADQGYSLAQKNLAVFCGHGLGGLARDMDEAARPYRQVAHAESTTAQGRLSQPGQNWVASQFET